MKIKEVSERTGLTKKTIRFYESEGLLSPEKTWRNGREYRDYSDADILQLEKIAALRRARFSVEEIRHILSVPADIPTVFQDYRSRLQQEEQNLQVILSVVNGISAEALTDPDTLIEAVKPVTYGLPLPAADLDPHFRYLDELEELSGLMKNLHPGLTEQEFTQRRIAAMGAAMYAGSSIQNTSSNNAIAGKGGGFDISNAQKIAAYNILVNTRDKD